MVGFRAHTLLDEMAMAVQVRHRGESSKDFKVSYEVRLVGVSAVSRKRRPVDARRGTADPRQRVLESPDAAEEFRRHRHFVLEQLDEPALAEPDRSSDLPSTRPGLRATEDIEGSKHLPVVMLSTGQLTDQPALEHVKPVRSVGTFGQPVMKVAADGATHIAQVDVTSARFTRRYAQEGQRTAEPEVDAQD